MQQNCNGCTGDYFLYEVGVLEAQENLLTLYGQDEGLETDGDCGCVFRPLATQ